MAHSPPAEQPRDLSRLTTVALASAGSVVAALVVSKIWGPGTLIGAAATPVIITLVAELLRKPVQTVVVRTPSGTQVHEVGAARPRAGAADASGEPTIVAGPEVVPPSRRGLKVALVTGLIAFVIGAFVLTSTELIFGDSAGSGGSATTLFSKKQSRAPTTNDEPATGATGATGASTPPTVSTVTKTTTAPATPTDTGETPPPAVPEGTTGATGATGATAP